MVSPFSGGWCRPSVAIATALTTLATLTVLTVLARATSSLGLGIWRMLLRLKREARLKITLAALRCSQLVESQLRVKHTSSRNERSTPRARHFILYIYKKL